VAALSGAPVIGYTLELEDPMLPHVEPALREPLERFGAVTVMLPRSTPADRVDALLDLVDGVLLSGGADVHPRHYAEEVHELTRPIADAHDEFEIALARAALDRGTPLLGICRGIQVLAVADGGRLTQDVETFTTAHTATASHGWTPRSIRRASTGTRSKASRARRPSAGWPAARRA
jgi:putative glutamine amidotransferase